MSRVPRAGLVAMMVVGLALSFSDLVVAQSRAVHTLLYTIGLALFLVGLLELVRRRRTP